MKTWIHFLASLILAAALYSVFSWMAIFIFVGGVLIDIDHYFWFIYKYKKSNFFDCYKHYKKLDGKNSYHENIGIMLIFHSIEFIMLLILLSFYSKAILIITIGFLTHFIMDIIFVSIAYKRIVSNLSIISWLIKNKIQKV